MEKNDQKIKNIFQHKLEEHHFEFKEEAWGHMEELLDTAPVSLMKPFWKKGMFWGTIAASVLLLFISQYYFQTTINTNSPLVDTSVIKKSKPFIVEKQSSTTKAIANKQDEKDLKRSKNETLTQGSNKDTGLVIPDFYQEKNSRHTHLIKKSEVQNSIVEVVASLGVKTGIDSSQKEGISTAPELKTKKSITTRPGSIKEDFSFFNDLENQWNKANDHYSPEKVYLHLDRKKFTQGESIWFAAYVRNALDLKQSAKSDLLHVEFLNDSNEVLKQMTIVQQKGGYKGDIQMPFGIRPGKYSLRAYTNWQRNLGHLFEREIEVLAAISENDIVADIESPDNNRKLEKQEIDVQFFAEGGNWIEGLPGKVAYKAIAGDGLSIGVKGILYDAKGNALKNFESGHAGMGAVDLSQIESGMYAEVEAETGLVKKIPLPAPAKDAAMLRVAAQDRKRLFVDVRSAIPRKLNLVFSAKNKVYYKKTMWADKEAQVVEIPTGDLPMTIANISLYEEMGAIIAERMVFVNKDKQLDVQIKTNRNEFFHHDKVMVDIEVKDDKGNPVQGTFSFGVAQQFEDHQGHILSYYMLESELEGYIEKPNFYFEKGKDEVLQSKALDCLMLTQGYRGNQWKKWGSESLAKLEYKGEKAIVSGIVKDEYGQPLANAKVKLSGLSGNVRTDDKGYYAFNSSDFKDFNTAIDAEYRGMRGSVRIDHFGKNFDIALRKNHQVRGMVVDEKGHPIAGANIYFKKNPALGYKTDSDGYYSFEYDESGAIVVIEKKGYIKNEAMLNGRNSDLNLKLKSIQKNENENKTAYGIEGEMVKKSKEEIRNSIQKALDKAAFDMKAPVEDGNGRRASVVLSDVNEQGEEWEQYVKAYTYLLANYLSDIEKENVSSKTLQQQLDVLNEFEKNIEKMEYKLNGSRYLYALNFNNGYYMSRNFYVPKYRVKSSGFHRQYGATNYWHPSVETNENGQAHVEFNLSETKGDFEAILEGFSSGGLTGRATLNMEVSAAVSLKTERFRMLNEDNTLAVDVAIQNNTGQAIKGKWDFDLPRDIKDKTKGSKKLILAPKEKIVKTFHFKIKNKDLDPFKIGFFSKNYRQFIIVD